MNTTSPPLVPPAPEAVESALRALLDPEIGLNVVDLGMVGGIDVDGTGAVTVEIMPTTPGCPMHDALAQGVQNLVEELHGVTAVDVRFVYDPPWTPDRIAPATRALLGLA